MIPRSPPISIFSSFGHSAAYAEHPRNRDFGPVRLTPLKIGQKVNFHQFAQMTCFQAKNDPKIRLEHSKMAQVALTSSNRKVQIWSNFGLSELFPTSSYAASPFGYVYCRASIGTHIQRATLRFYEFAEGQVRCAASLVRYALKTTLNFVKNRFIGVLNLF